MSRYARNHLQDDWAAIAAADAAQRLRAAERTAAWYFDRATVRSRGEYDAGLRALRGATGLEADCDRDALQQRWLDATAEERALFEATVRCLLDDGEVSAELDDAWTALFAGEEARNTAVPAAQG